MRSIVCVSTLSDTVAMENHSALRAEWLFGQAWFLETRLFHTVQVPDDFRSTFEKNAMRPEIVEDHLLFTINHDAL